MIRHDIEAEQVPINSSDVTAACLSLPEGKIFVASVYVPCVDQAALKSILQLIKRAVESLQARHETMEIILAGDFNRHDALWGGEAVNPQRQGEAELILELMDELSLISLLPRGTTTWQNGDRASTIDLLLVSADLADRYQQCKIHDMEHGSDHRAIEARFNFETPETSETPRFLFKNAPWREIGERVKRDLRAIPRPQSTQGQADRLIQIVSEAVFALTPKSKPSPYAKRWWTRDLTQLRKSYTAHRNKARNQRRNGQADQRLENKAHKAAKIYHTTLRRQKKSHWEEFLAEESNIWSAARYLRPQKQGAFGKIPPLLREDGTYTESKSDLATELLKTFFPPLPSQINDEPTRLRPPAELAWNELSTEEIKSKVFDASPWKAPGADGLPTIVWRQLWPNIQEEVTSLFRASIQEGTLPSQWRKARIIPLKKPSKADYTLARAWRPISLLSTLGKILEAVLAERLSFLAETHNLLPQNHFGARRRRSAE